LKAITKPLKLTDFVFTHKSHPISAHHFKKAFERYCGQEFYPHIVRSHYATTEARAFLHHRRNATKKEVQSLFLKIAGKLGHKKYVKKKNMWEDNSSVTVNHYIQPELVERVKRLVK
jgi:hypothetical protein